MSESTVLHDVHYVAEVFGISVRRVYVLAETGGLGHYKLGHRTLRFSDEHLAAFLDAKELKADA